MYDDEEDRNWDTVGKSILDSLKANPTPFIYVGGFIALLVVWTIIA